MEAEIKVANIICERYKKDTDKLLRWLINKYKAIIEAAENPNAISRQSRDLYHLCNEKNSMKSSMVPTMCQFIAENGGTVRPDILQRFRDVIQGRKHLNGLWCQYAASLEKPDRSIESKNRTHRHFIDILEESLNVMDGICKRASGVHAGNDELGLGMVASENSFALLDLEGNPVDEATGDEQRCGAQELPATMLERASTPLCGGVEPTRAAEYRLVMDLDDLYQIASKELAQSWIHMRHFIQQQWRECAYGTYNTAVAAGVSNAGIASVQRSSSVMFTEFDGNDEYEALIKKLTGVDLFDISASVPEDVTAAILATVIDDEELAPESGETRGPDIDVRELLMVYTYSDLRDFLHDCRAHPRGRPTKRIRKSVRGWNLKLDLMTTSRVGRVQWRRVFTIKWLYALLMHVTSDESSARWPLEPWSKQRRLFGFNEFAKWLTGLATQKEDVDFGKQVPPHRVFQLQCMVDSFMVARGWIVSHSGRDILVTAAQGFSATRDVCRFTDMYSRRVDVLVDRLEGTVNPAIIELLGRLKTNFSGWLCGPNPHGNHTSRAGAYGSLFPHDEEPNALWDFSPYLCGAGLVEALESAHIACMEAMNSIPQVTWMTHLQNLLLAKRILRQAVGPWKYIVSLIQSVVFTNGNPPEGSFRVALWTCPAMKSLLQSAAREKNHNFESAGAAALSDEDINRYLDAGGRDNVWRKIRSRLSEYSASGWSVLRLVHEVGKPDFSNPAHSSLKMVQEDILRDVSSAQAVSGTD